MADDPSDDDCKPAVDDGDDGDEDYAENDGDDDSSKSDEQFWSDAEYCQQSEEDEQPITREERKRPLPPAAAAAEITEASNEARKKEKSDHPVAKINPDHLYVDWDRMATSRWGKDRLDRYLPVLEIDALVGWATNLESYHRPLPGISSNPLLGLCNIPLRPSLIKYLIQDPASKIAANAKEKRLFERCHHSAAVAIGMLAEEMLTATLLPLAAQHVQRCRQLESSSSEMLLTDVRSSSSSSISSTEADAERRAREHVFQEWTLPPEEVLANLLLLPVPKSSAIASGHQGLVTARPPTKSSVSGAPGTSLLNMPAAGARERNAFAVWCHSRHLDPTFVQDNMDLFGLLLQAPPVANQSSTAPEGAFPPGHVSNEI